MILSPNYQYTWELDVRNYYLKERCRREFLMKHCQKIRRVGLKGIEIDHPGITMLQLAMNSGGLRHM